MGLVDVGKILMMFSLFDTKLECDWLIDCYLGDGFTGQKTQPTVKN